MDNQIKGGIIGMAVGAAAIVTILCVLNKEIHEVAGDKKRLGALITGLSAVCILNLCYGIGVLIGGYIDNKVSNPSISQNSSRNVNQ